MSESSTDNDRVHHHSDASDSSICSTVANNQRRIVDLNNSATVTGNLPAEEELSVLAKRARALG